jgi:hypothetical protein
VDTLLSQDFLYVSSIVYYCGISITYSFSFRPKLNEKKMPLCKFLVNKSVSKSTLCDYMIFRKLIHVKRKEEENVNDNTIIVRIAFVLQCSNKALVTNYVLH